MSFVNILVSALNEPEVCVFPEVHTTVGDFKSHKWQSCEGDLGYCAVAPCWR